MNDGQRVEDDGGWGTDDVAGMRRAAGVGLAARGLLLMIGLLGIGS